MLSSSVYASIAGVPTWRRYQRGNQGSRPPLKRWVKRIVLPSNIFHTMPEFTINLLHISSRLIFSVSGGLCSRDHLLYNLAPIFRTDRRHHAQSSSKHFSGRSTSDNYYHQNDVFLKSAVGLTVALVMFVLLFNISLKIGQTKIFPLAVKLQFGVWRRRRNWWW